MIIMPENTSDNAWCPTCKLKFVLHPENDQVICLGCRFIQLLPIIYIGPDEFLCVNCTITFTSTDKSPKCHQCHSHQIVHSG